jgi:RNA polymerase sigma-70 factor (ECF subfamily)
MYRLALGLVRDPDQAKDLVQDTVARALRFQHRFQVGTNFRGWIHTILFNTFRNQYQRRGRERRLFEGAEQGDLEAALHAESAREHARAPENRYLERMVADDLVAAIETLPEEQRAVLILCDVEGLSYREIADAIDCPVGTVMSRLFRARHRLQKKLHAVAVAQGIVRPEQDDDVVDIGRYRRNRRVAL